MNNRVAKKLRKLSNYKTPKLNDDNYVVKNMQRKTYIDHRNKEHYYLTCTIELKENNSRKVYKSLKKQWLKKTQ